MEAEVQRLVDLYNNDPEQFIQEFNDDVSVDVIDAVNRLIDPANTSKMVGCDKAMSAAISVINNRRDYLVRFLVTSLAGFVNQMASEYEVSEEQRTWTSRAVSEESAKLVPPTQWQTKIKTMAKISDDLVEAEQEMIKAHEASLLDDKYDPAKLEATKSKYMGLNYMMTHMLFTNGQTAANTLHSIGEECKKFPDCKVILDRFKNIPGPTTHTMPQKTANQIVTQFVNGLFKYNPAIHVRSGNSERTKGKKITEKSIPHIDDMDTDPLGLSFEDLKKPIVPDTGDVQVCKLLEDNPRIRSAIMCLISECDPTVIKCAKAALDNPVKFRRYLLPEAAKAITFCFDNIPPQDTYHRFNYYTAVNYEAIQAVTNALYYDRPVFDQMIAIWKVFDGTEEENKKSFLDFVEQNQDSTSSDIIHVPIDGSWVVLMDVKGNRERIEFYNKHTAIIKEILDRHTEDKKQGAELMRNRIIKGKAKQVAESGPDADGLAEYKRMYPQLAAQGAKKVITDEEMERIAKSSGDLELKHEIEQYESLLARRKALLELSQRGAKLNRNETIELENLNRQITQAEESLKVPKDAVQINIFQHDTEAGVMKTSTEYIKAETADEVRAREQIKMDTFNSK